MYKARGWRNMTNHSIAVDAIAHVLLFEMSVSLCLTYWVGFMLCQPGAEIGRSVLIPTFEDPWSEIRDLVLMMA